MDSTVVLIIQKKAPWQNSKTSYKIDKTQRPLSTAMDHRSDRNDPSLGSMGLLPETDHFVVARSKCLLC